MIEKNLPHTHASSLLNQWRLNLITREKSDTLLLVLACLSVVLIHCTYAVWWIGMSSIALMVWRSWLTLTGRRLPSRWVLVPIAITLMSLIFLQFRTFLGREAGVAMLIILLSLKMLEMHAKRDLYVVIYLGLFLLTTSLLNSQSLISAFLVLIILSLLLCAQLSFQYKKQSISIWLRFQFIFKILALAIPFTIFSFVFFPRIQGPFWSMPKDANNARSGLSDSMSPGNISRLAMSEELVFRAKIDGIIPEKSSLYWRAIVLNQFNGKTWSHQENHLTALKLDPHHINNTIKQQIILEPNDNDFLFALDTPIQAPQIQSMNTKLNIAGELRATQMINKRLRYEVMSSPQYRLQTPTESLHTSLQLPPYFNPKTLQFAEDIQTRFQGKKAQIQAILRYFRNENFSYTLEPPLLGLHSVDDFLFNTRQGFCEHYSSAFVVLMRAIGIPARVVTGYQGGSINQVDGYLEIRQSDAHAWAEVWLDEAGWVRIDPTAEVAPDRILEGLNFTQKQQGFSGLVQSVIGENSLLNHFRMRWSAINNSWNQWVLNYSQSTQNNLLESLGLSQLDWVKTITLLFLAGITLIALMALPLLRHRIQQSPVDQVYFKFLSRMSKTTLAKNTGEGPHAYLLRLQTYFQPQQNKLTTQLITQFIMTYIEFQYGKNPPTEKDTVQQLNYLLKQIR